MRPPLAQVRFEARSFQVGDKRFDACFNLDMDATLSHRPPAKPSLGQGMVDTLRSWKRGLAMATGTHPEASVRSLSSLDDPPHPSTLALPPPPTSDPHASSSSSSSPHSALAAQAAQTLPYDPQPAMRPLHPHEQQPHQQQQAPQPQPQPLATEAAAAAAATPHPIAPTPIAPAPPASALHAGTAPAPAPLDGALQPGEASVAPAPDAGSDGAVALAVVAPPPPPPADAGSLHCEVDLRFKVTLPSPLSVVPGPMLALAGSLLARFAVRALLPGFLELLSVDYSRCVSFGGAGGCWERESCSPLNQLAATAVRICSTRPVCRDSLVCGCVRICRWATGSSSRGREAAGSLLAAAAPSPPPPGAPDAAQHAAAASGAAPAHEGAAGGAEEAGGYLGGGARLGTAMAGFAAAVGVSATASGAPPPGA